MAGHEASIPLSIDAVLHRLEELEVVLGVQVRPVLASVSAALREALAARDSGDVPESVAKIGEAMDRLSSLADGLDPEEAAMMRAVSQLFRTALLRGDTGEARRTADVMFDRSGARYRSAKDDGSKND